MAINGRTRMSVIQLRCKVIEVSIKIIVGLGGQQTISRMFASEGVGKMLTAYCVDSIRRICARMSVVDSSKGGGEFK